jgi:hypothetical protein
VTPAEARRAAARLAALLLAAAAALAQAQRAAQAPPPGHTRSVAVVPIGAAPVIDGMLDDPAWVRAGRADGFWNSLQDRPPSESTEVLVTADATHLFFAFKVFDSDPAGIVALQQRRDADLGLDDQVAVVLDPFLGYRDLATYRVNAAGTQRDEIGAGRARQLAWKGNWQAAVARTGFGWVAEIAIPFDILNFPPGVDTIGINFQRFHHRSGEWSSWADLTVRNLPEEMGRLSGLRPRLAQKAAPVTFMPYLLAGRNIRDRRGERRAGTLDAGIDVRYQPRTDLTGVLSIRPDFSQVESSVADIDFRYTEKFQTDPRPFFQEGSSYFSDERMYFYSNRIPMFDYALKAFGNAGACRFGALSARSANHRSDNVVALSHGFDATHQASAIAVGTDRADLRNRLFAVRGRGREASGLQYGIDAANTRTEPQDRSGSFLKAQLGWGRNDWSAGATADRYGRFFAPADGLLAGDLPDTAGRTAYVSYYRDRAEGRLREVRGDLSYEERETGDGRLQRRRSYAAGSVELRELQLRIGAAWFSGPYRPVAGSPGSWKADLLHDRTWTGSLDFNTRSSRSGYGVAYSSGMQGGGDYSYLSAYAWARPTVHTFVNLTSERLQNFGTFHQTVVSGGWDFSPSQTLSGRVIDAYYGHAYRLAYTWRARPNLDLFVVWDRSPGQPAQLALKLLATL